LFLEIHAAALLGGRFILSNTSEQAELLRLAPVSNLVPEERTMFRVSLLETSDQEQKNRRRSLVVAFVGEIVVASILMLFPLVSTGIIPVSPRVPIFAPLAPFRVHAQPPESGARNGTTLYKGAEIVAVPSSSSAICFLCKHTSRSTQDAEVSPSLNPPGGNRNGAENLASIGNVELPRHEPDRKRIVISTIDPGQLIKKVEPAYPRLAALTGTSGVVKLHAIISKEGTIQSLNVISGHPMLIPAAVDAVSQWRYRPYFLNGQAVEVETFITIHFHRPGE
jgi:periplasmic protein TonB